MYAFVIVGLFLAAASLELAAGTPAPDPWVTVPGTVLVCLGVFLAGLLMGRTILWRRALLDRDEQRYLRQVRRLGKLFRLLVLAAYALILWGLDWAALAARAPGGADWTAPALAVAAAPLVALLALAWTAVFWADRRLRAVLFERAGAPVTFGPWTLPRYLEFMFRQYLLVLLVPLLVLLTADDALARWLGPAEEPLATGLAVAGVMGAMVLAPVWVRYCWRTGPLPDGDLRRRLLAVAGRAGVRVGNILVWRTNHTIANGCMIGLVGPLRYIFITDALLLAMSATPEEVEAVFAHEVAHIKYRHVALYLVLGIGGASAALVAGEAAALLTDSVYAMNAAAVAVLAAYWGLGFGYVSRRCELECDLYAVRATECPAACSPPDGGLAAKVGTAPVPGLLGTGTVPLVPMAAGSEAKGTVPLSEQPETGTVPLPETGAVPLPETGTVPFFSTGPCEHRVFAFVNALRRIARLNGAVETARGWRHFSIARRCAMLLELPIRPQKVALYERHVRRVKRATLIAALLAVLAAGAVIAMLGPGLETDHPEHPARPQDVSPQEPTWLIRLVDGDEMDGLALRPPEFDGQADLPADLDDGRLARLRGHVAPADDQVAVAQTRGHAVAVDAQGERPRPDRAEAR